MNQPVTSQYKPAHFLLACVELTFMDDDGQTGITRLNTMVKSEDGRVNVELLGRTQQAAQIQLRKKLQDPNVNVLDVVVFAVSDLGIMTDEEFHGLGQARAQVNTDETLN